MPAPFLAPYIHQFSAVVQIMHFFDAISILIKIYAETETSNDAIWDEFGEQY